MFLTSPDYPLADDTLGFDFDFTTDSFKLLQPTTDFIAITFVKRPAEMIIDQSMLELPDEFEELVIEKATLTMLRKKDPKMVNASIMQFYKALVADSKEYLASLQPPDAYTIDPEHVGITTYTPGYSEYYW